MEAAMEAAQTPTIQMLTRANIIVAFMITIFDYLLAPLYKRLLLTTFYLYKASRALYIGDSSKYFAVISLTAVLIALSVSGSDTFSVFFGVRLALKHVLVPAVRNIDYRVTDEESQVDVLFGPVPLVFYVGTCVLLRNVDGILYLVLHFGLHVVAAGLAHWLVTSVVVGGNGWSHMRVDLKCRLKALLDFAAWVIARAPDALGALIRAMIDLFDCWDALRIDKKKSTASEGKMYKYQPLSPAPEIRLLRVLQRKMGTELRCELEVFDLDKAPVYEAISYTWRNQLPTEELLVNRRSLIVTPAVKELVGYFQSFISQRYLWIDGVCINQGDDIEKSQQVPLMGEIYRRADRVVVWLGPQGEVRDAYDARRVLCFLAYTWRHSGHESQGYLRMLSNQRDLRWPAVVRLFSHPWFSRAWVVQEIALPRTVHLIYGEICLDWDMIAATSRIMMDPFIVGITQTDRALDMDLSRKGRLVQLSNIRTMGWIRNEVQEGHILSLGRVLGACVDFEAKYSRDKIFSILGIAVDGGHPDLAPNYTKPAAEVYVDVMRHIVSSGNNRDIDIAIQFAGIGFQRALEMQNLPSWVPDWSYPPAGRVIQDSHSIPEGPEEAINFMFTDTEHLLKLGGVEIDRIGDLGRVWRQSDIEPTDIVDMEEWVNSLCSWMREAHAMAQGCSQHLYPNEEAITEALWQALKAPSGEPEREDNSTANLAFIWQQLENFVDHSVEFPSFESPSAREFLIEIRPMVVALGRALGKRFCVTEEGRMTLVPPTVEKGNLICYVRGLQMPIVLRKKQMGERKAAEHYELLGNCIIDGHIRMMGSAMWKWYTIV